MKLNLLRLVSVAPFGVGGVETLDIIYNFLLQEFHSDYYSHIHINQIGDDLEEFILKKGKNIHVNIRYPTEGSENKSEKEKELIRLDIIHTALLRIAKKEEKLDVIILEKIRDSILEQNFEFDFVYKQFDNKKNQIIGKLIIHPGLEKFCYYFTTEKNDQEISRILIYEGKSSDIYIQDIFNTGKWVNSKEFVITDKKKEFEMHIYIEENRFELINLTQYKNPPYFEMWKFGGTNEEAYKDWLHSMPPGIAAILNYKPN